MLSLEKILDAHDDFLVRNMKARELMIHRLYCLAERLSEQKEDAEWCAIALDAIEYITSEH